MILGSNPLSVNHLGEKQWKNLLFLCYFSSILS
nr:MAG TPA: hypothetical protein [Caudoviricetes sp.]